MRKGKSPENYWSYKVKYRWVGDVLLLLWLHFLRYIFTDGISKITTNTFSFLSSSNLQGRIILFYELFYLTRFLSFIFFCCVWRKVELKWTRKMELRRRWRRRQRQNDYIVWRIREIIIIAVFRYIICYIFLLIQSFEHTIRIRIFALVLRALPPVYVNEQLPSDLMSRVVSLGSSFCNIYIIYSDWGQKIENMDERLSFPIS